jgi:hypothetical protein
VLDTYSVTTGLWPQTVSQRPDIGDPLSGLSISAMSYVVVNQKNFSLTIPNFRHIPHFRRSTGKKRIKS